MADTTLLLSKTMHVTYGDCAVDFFFLIYYSGKSMSVYIGANEINIMASLILHLLKPFWVFNSALND